MKRVEDQQILSAIAEMTASCGYPPTFRELGKRLGIGVASIFVRVDRLRAAGIILPSDKESGGQHRQEGTKTRGLRLTEAGWEQIRQPAVPLSALPRVRHLPVFRSSEALSRYLATPAFRVTLAESAALAAQDVQIIPIAELRSKVGGQS